MGGKKLKLLREGAVKRNTLYERAVKRNTLYEREVCVHYLVHWTLGYIKPFGNIYIY